MEKMIAKIITMTAVATFVAMGAVTMSTPTFAQSYDPSVGSGNIVPGPKGGMEPGTSSRPLYNFAPLSGRHHHRMSRRVRMMR